MSHTRVGFRFTLAALAAACFVSMPPLAATAAGGPEGPQQPPRSGGLVVQKVENGPAAGIEFKFTEIDRQDVWLVGGYAGYTFDNRLFVGGAGYWQVDDYWNSAYDVDYYYGDCYYGCGGYGGYDGYHHASGYGGLAVEWFPLRTPIVSVSARGLVGGGVTSVGWNDYAYIQEPSPHHGSVYPPVDGYYWHDQGYFVFEPQVNIGVRIVPGLSLVGGVGYRVIGWADGWEDRIGGLTGSVAIRFGR
jgi:hypothetical protein